MSRATTIITLLAGMFAAMPSVANQSMTGNNLHSFCEGSEPFCLGFAAGVMHGMTIADWDDVCLPQVSMPLKQLSDVIIKYLRDHPEQRHHDSAVLTALAINTAWPDTCEAK